MILILSIMYSQGISDPVECKVGRTSQITNNSSWSCSYVERINATHSQNKESLKA